jgi:transcriptional regulator with XRE-family HTH domain
MGKSDRDLRQRRRAHVLAMVRYRLRVSKDDLTFREVLASSIERWYESDSDFARKAGVSTSAVSRWVAGENVPTPNTIEKIAPYVRDSRGRPISAIRLTALAFPSLSEVRVQGQVVFEPEHPLARELARMLADDSPLPADRRENLEALLEALVAPYRIYMRKRKSA